MRKMLRPLLGPWSMMPAQDYEFTSLGAAMLNPVSLSDAFQRLHEGRVELVDLRSGSERIVES